MAFLGIARLSQRMNVAIHRLRNRLLARPNVDTPASSSLNYNMVEGRKGWFRLKFPNQRHDKQDDDENQEGQGKADLDVVRKAVAARTHYQDIGRMADRA